MKDKCVHTKSALSQTPQRFSLVLGSSSNNKDSRKRKKIVPHHKKSWK